MDHRRFDELTRFTATHNTRRGLIRTLSGGALAAALTQVGLAGAEAKPKPKKKRCRKRKKLGQVCKLTNGAACRCLGGAVCRAKRCRCPRGTQQSGKRCVPISTCVANGAVCPNGSSDACCSGFCTFEGPIDEVEPTCCVPNDGLCKQSSDCCVNDENPAACEAGRCCRGLGGTCATPNGFQIADCCFGLTCDANGTQQCVAFGIGAP
jgi:hypothetical protein